MMKLKVILITVMVLAVTLSCASKPEPNDMSIGISLTNRAADYALQGDKDMAAYTYNRALAKFRDMGKFCDMARVAFLMYIIAPNEENINKKDDALSFATLGECKSEINIANFLTGNDYDYATMDEPYKSIAEFWRNKDISPLKKLVSSDNTSDRVKSSLYRVMARHVMNQWPKDALNYAKHAKEIDGKHAWTQNILYDEELILEASKLLKLDTQVVEKRIEILTHSVEEKNR
ncbi:MAG: hypothetical protein IJD28_03055 [Deferribacterales bacterium]|nr:hypothetical protein [Deferribacterales bacterium]